MSTQATASGTHTGGECNIPTGSSCTSTGFLGATITPIGTDVLQAPFTYTWQRVIGPPLNDKNTIQVVSNARTAYAQTSLTGIATNNGDNIVQSRYDITITDSSNPPITVSTTIDTAQYNFRGTFASEPTPLVRPPNRVTVGKTIQQFDTLITTSTTPTLLAEWNVSEYESSEATITATSGVDRHIVRLLITHNETNAFVTTTDSVLSGGSLFTPTVAVSNGVLGINVQSASATETKYDIAQSMVSPVLANVVGTHTGGSCTVTAGESCTASGTLSATITPATGVTLQAPYTYIWTRVGGAQVNNTDSISLQSSNTTEQVTTEITGTATNVGSNEVTSKYVVEVIDSSTPPVRITQSVATATYDFVGT